MEKTFQITIPKPCSQRWDNMNPTGSGRFCGQCAKTVVDFTAMETGEIRNYFSENTGSKICGRFDNRQLGTLTVSIPVAVIFSQTQFRKSFLLALFVTMGTSLFSCSNGSGDRQSIDRIEVTDESSSGHTLGAPMRTKIIDTTSELPKPKKSVVRFVENPGTTKGEVVLVQPKNDSVEFVSSVTHIDTIP